MNLGEDERLLQSERQMIEEIKKRPYLWDETLPEHKDLEKAKAAWDTIARMFGLSAAKVKSRWKSMRDIYVRYLRKLALKQGSAPPKWKHFEAMSFITDHIKHRRTDLQYPDYGIGAPASEDGHGGNVNQGLQYSALRNSDDDEDATDASLKPGARGRKRKHATATVTTSTPIMATKAPNVGMRPGAIGAGGPVRGANGSTLLPGGPALMPDGQPGNMVMHQQRMPAPPHQHQPISSVMNVSSIVSSSTGMSNGRNGTGQDSLFGQVDDDADDLFGRSIAATLKKMTPRMKALSKLRMQQVLYELEEAATNTPPPNAVVYQNSIAGPPNPQQQQQQNFM